MVCNALRERRYTWSSSSGSSRSFADTPQSSVSPLCFHSLCSGPSQGTLCPTSAGHSELAPVTLASLAVMALLTCPDAEASQGLSDGKGEGVQECGKGRDHGRKHRTMQGVGRLRTRWKAGNPHETFKNHTQLQRMILKCSLICLKLRELSTEGHDTARFPCKRSITQNAQLNHQSFQCKKKKRESCSISRHVRAMHASHNINQARQETQTLSPSQR